MPRMKFEIRNTRDFAQKGINILVYSMPGMGKTTMASTVKDKDSVLILSVESGLLSLVDMEMDYLIISSFDDLRDVFTALQMREDKFEKYEWIVLDSVTEIAEVCLREAQDKHKHGLEAYQELKTSIFGLLRNFRDLDRHVYMSAKEETKEINDVDMHFPMMPGNALRQGVAYDYDFVAHLREVRGEDKKMTRVLWFAKSIAHPHLKERAPGRIGESEEPNLHKLLNKIIQPKKKEKK